MLAELAIPGSQVASLRDVPVADLVAAGTAVYAAVPLEEPGMLAFAPVVDGVLIPEHPATALTEGRGLPVPLMIGTNKDEAALFKFMKSPLIPITEQAITQMLTTIAAERPDLELPTREQLLAAYVGVRANAIGLGIARDIGFRMPTLWVAEGHARAAPVWLYRFDYATLMLRIIGLGATHGTELPYVWGNLETGQKDITFKFGGRSSGQAISERMQRRWRSFAVTGSPTTPDDELEWAMFEPDGDRATLVIDRHDSLVLDLDAPLRAAWGDEVLSFR